MTASINDTQAPLRLYQGTFMTWGEPIMLISRNLKDAAALLEMEQPRNGKERMLLMEVTEEWLALSGAAEHTRKLLAAGQGSYVEFDEELGWRLIPEPREK